MFTIPLLVVLSAVAHQAPAPRAPSGPVMAAMVPQYERVKDYLLRSAEQMPEEHYAFKPAATVRTFGQQIAHVAETHYVFCATARNEPNPRPEEFEKTTTAKAGLLEALRASFAYCDTAYQMTDAQATTATRTADGRERVALSTLLLNIAHDNEHYGNVVTYLRIKDFVPPSSQPRKQD